MSVKGVAGQLNLILDKYCDRLNVETDNIMNDVSRETADELRQNSPRRKGAYARSWTVKKDKHRYIVHNKDHYRLTHLLEYPHDIRNQYGTYVGQTNAQPHIYRAEQNATVRLLKRLNNELSDL